MHSICSMFLSQIILSNGQYELPWVGEQFQLEETITIMDIDTSDQPSKFVTHYHPCLYV